MLSSGLPTAADALADIKAARVLRVAVPRDFPPFVGTGLDMSPMG